MRRFLRCVYKQCEVQTWNPFEIVQADELQGSPLILSGGFMEALPKISEPPRYLGEFKNNLCREPSRSVYLSSPLNQLDYFLPKT